MKHYFGALSYLFIAGVYVATGMAWWWVFWVVAAAFMAIFARRSQLRERRAEERRAELAVDRAIRRLSR